MGRHKRQLEGRQNRLYVCCETWICDKLLINFDGAAGPQLGQPSCPGGWTHWRGQKPFKKRFLSFSLSLFSFPSTASKKNDLLIW